MGLNPYMVIGFHFIGVIVSLVISYKTGAFEEASSKGYGYYGYSELNPSPSDLVFAALVWEFELLFWVLCYTGYVIDEFFRNKYDADNKK